MKRDADKRELAVFRKFERSVIDGRDAIAAYLAACSCMAQLEQLRRAMVAEGTISGATLPVLFSDVQIAQAQTRAEKWNQIEIALDGLKSGRFGYQVVRDRDGNLDLNVYEPPELAGLPFILMAVGAAVIIGAIITVVAMVNANKSDARKLRRDLANLNAKMSQMDPVVARRFENLQKSTNFTQEKSIWDRLKEGLGGAAGVALLVVAGIMILGRTQRGSA